MGKQTNICTLPSVLRKNRKTVKSLKKRAFDFFVEFVLLCCLLSFLRPLKVKKKETKLRLLQPFLTTRLGIKRRDRRKRWVDLYLGLIIFQYAVVGLKLVVIITFF